MSELFLSSRQADHIGNLVADILKNKVGPNKQWRIPAKMVQEIFEDGFSTELLLQRVAQLLKEMTLGRYDLEYPNCKAEIWHEKTENGHLAHIVPRPWGSSCNFGSVESAIGYSMDHGCPWVIDDDPSLRRRRISIQCGCCRKMFYPRPFEATGDETCPHCRWRGPYPSSRG